LSEPYPSLSPPDAVDVAYRALFGSPAPPTNTQLREWRSLLNAITQPPWRWFGNTAARQVYLATAHSGQVMVLSFHRWGFHGAQPYLQREPRTAAMTMGSGVVPASTLCRYDVLHGKTRAEAGLGPKDDSSNSPLYREDFTGIDHPDALLLERAPEIIDALLTEVERLRGYHG
jgi:hypothetical protein